MRSLFFLYLGSIEKESGKEKYWHFIIWTYD